MSAFRNTNYDLMQKMWRSIDLEYIAQIMKDDAGKKLNALKKDVSKKVISIIHEPVWTQAHKFQVVHGQYIKQSASAHEIPYQLLGGILFTEMTFNFTPLWFDDALSLGKLAVSSSSSVGPGQMNTDNLKKWGHKENKWGLGWKLNTDMNFAIDASAIHIHERVVIYQKRQLNETAKNIELEIIRVVCGRNYTPPNWNNYKPDTGNQRTDTRNLEREAWPTIASWYNGKIDTKKVEFKNKFIKNLSILGY